jgi:hypothetical protein
VSQNHILKNKIEVQRNPTAGVLFIPMAQVRSIFSPNARSTTEFYLIVAYVHLEAIVNVVLLNLQELPRIGAWANTAPPAGLEATRAYSAPGKFTKKDWAGVEGTWRRFVCFMDYRDLFGRPPANKTLLILMQCSVQF